MTNSDPQEKVFSSILEAIESVSDKQYEHYLREDYVPQSATPYNPFSKTAYSGINRFHLSIINIFGIKESPYFGTFKQINNAGGSVKKGSKSFDVLAYIKTFSDRKTGKKVYESVYERMTEQEKKEVNVFTRVKLFKVFSFDDIKNVEDLDVEIPNKPIVAYESQVERLGAIEEFVSATGCDILTKNASTAYYNKIADNITMPPVEAFVDTNHYYCTLFHELVHFSGPRLNRNLGGMEEEYSFEELVAESGAIFLCMKFDITALILSSCAYMKSYLQMFPNGRATALEAITEGSRAYKFLLGMSSRKEAAA